VLSNPDLAAISREIRQEIEMLSNEGTSGVLLVIDQLDAILATGGERISAVDIDEMLSELREVRGSLKVNLIDARN
jgi:elongator complex protein 6